MEGPEFTNLLIVVTIGFAAPFALGLIPRLQLPAVVLEILLGIVVGPSGLGWVEVDEAVEVISVIGLAFLLFLGGLEIDFDRLRGRLLRLAGVGYAVSFALAVVVALGLKGAGLVQTPLLIAIVLGATSLGVIIPVLKDADQLATRFGQLVLAAGSIADFGAIILLSVFFTGEGGIGATLVLIVGLVLLAAVIFVAARTAERSGRISADLLRLQNTTAQIRVRGAVLLLVGFAAAAETLGLEVILGTFIAGALLKLADRDEAMTHPDFHPKLAAIGFGVFIPVFFVTSGVRFDLDALLADGSTIVMVPIFLVALLAVRGLPALLYRGYLDPVQARVAALFQATSLPFIVAATTIGVDLGLVDQAESAALIAAGLLSVIIFPVAGVTMLRRVDPGSARTGPDDVAAAAAP
ncbi:MAG TPA: cation:proton antiporter [Solirubrobacterales bacterium]|nr:cation:proton antiporter [Solirubrobacterales bacterium]